MANKKTHKVYKMSNDYYRRLRNLINISNIRDKEEVFNTVRNFPKEELSIYKVIQDNLYFVIRTNPSKNFIKIEQHRKNGKTTLIWGYYE